jgi:hypothetical protein
LQEFRFYLASVQGDLSQYLKEKYGSVASAAKQAIGETANDLKTKGRADIGAAGFSSKWRNALRVNTYPKGSKPSIDAACFLYHKIEYSWVFEKGASIRGSRLLWIPLPNVPKRFGRSKMSPSQVREAGVQLVLARDPGHFPMLFARLTLGTRKAKDFAQGKLPKLSKSELVFGSKAGKTEEVRAPLFVGVASVTIKQRFHIFSLAERAFQELPGRYFNALKD